MIKIFNQAPSPHKRRRKMKKISYLFMVFIFLLVGSSSAMAYSVMFDPDASGTTYANEQVYGWDLEAYQDASVNGLTVDFATHQTLGADGILNDYDPFYESFTISVLNGLNSTLGGTGMQNYGGFPPTVPSANVYLDVEFSGVIVNYSNGLDGLNTTAADFENILDDSYYSNFTTGFGTMYIDNDNNQNLSVGDVNLATFSLNDSAPVVLVPSVFTGVGAAISFDFEFDSINSTYFSTAPGEMDPQTLIGKNWLFALTQGGIAGIDGALIGDEAADPDEIIIGFNETGFDSRLAVVPEPSTFILLGAGIVGLAFYRRKKS
jgi:hypothetical protein